MNTLPLARTTRPTHFDAIVGQELTVRLLKNSLYRQQFFPVYLLAGQRGCGKTTTARVFAAAINCAELPAFSKDPQQAKVPCESCASCRAFFQGQHPDFIEIDAASHTGVDNVRQIIEATSFVPQLGRKRIYLIDEAHMLSKAAFNALLKTLEEPPATALFMLATTDPHKILETVRSRCFQLFFDPVAIPVLVNHLAHVCQAEGLMFDEAGLELVARASEGSVRDALNLVERVRLGGERIDQQAVAAVLGTSAELWVFDLVRHMGQEDSSAVLTALTTNRYAPTQLWEQLGGVLHALLLLQYNVVAQGYVHARAQLEELRSLWPVSRLVAALRFLYGAEQQFLKTAAQAEFLQLTLLQLSGGTVGSSPSAPSRVVVQETLVAAETGRSAVVVQGPQELWDLVRNSRELGDALITSLVRQGRFERAVGNRWEIVFPQELRLFDELLSKPEAPWRSVLKRLAGSNVELVCSFSAHETPAKNAEVRPVQEGSRAALDAAALKAANENRSRAPVSNVQSVVLKDTSSLERTTTLLELFPGKVSEIKGER